MDLSERYVGKSQLERSDLIARKKILKLTVFII